MVDVLSEKQSAKFVMNVLATDQQSVDKNL